jgi:hypothetical protein
VTHVPRISVVMPVLNGMTVLPRSVAALEASDLPRHDWELLLVDDSSTDGTAEWAATRADRVIAVEGGPRGPGFARNVAAKEARGDLLAFVDADVCVHPDALERLVNAFVDERVGAVFGAYDERPTARDFLSQYRNLHHRYVHVLGAGDAETFWAGCGAVRRDLFLRLGGFDIARYPRPQIEDIELGYRIRDAGHAIRLDPRIQGTHLKRWRFTQMVRTDLFDRGIPWMRLILERGASGTPRTSLNIGGAEKLKTALMGLACLLALAAAVTLRSSLLLVAAAPVGAIVLLNLPIYRWYAEQRGWTFAARAVPVNLLYYVINGLAVAIALGERALSRRARA